MRRRRLRSRGGPIPPRAAGGLRAGSSNTRPGAEIGAGWAHGKARERSAGPRSFRFARPPQNVSWREFGPSGDAYAMPVVLSNVTVLILDDNPLVLKLGRALLEREGCTVLTASSWIEFNHVLASNAPDIIF